MIDPRLPDKNKKDDNDWEDEAYRNNPDEATTEDEVIEEKEEEKEDESESESIKGPKQQKVD